MNVYKIQDLKPGLLRDSELKNRLDQFENEDRTRRDRCQFLLKAIGESPFFKENLPSVFEVLKNELYFGRKDSFKADVHLKNADQCFDPSQALSELNQGLKSCPMKESKLMCDLYKRRGTILMDQAKETKNPDLMNLSFEDFERAAHQASLVDKDTSESLILDLYTRRISTCIDFGNIEDAFAAVANFCKKTSNTGPELGKAVESLLAPILEAVKTKDFSKEAAGCKSAKKKLPKSETRKVKVSFESGAKGRSLVATSNFVPFDRVLTETEPLFASLNLIEMDKPACFTCCKQIKNPLKKGGAEMDSDLKCLIPCETCSLVTFCSLECENVGKEIHKLECAFSQFLPMSPYYYGGGSFIRDESGLVGLVVKIIGGQNLQFFKTHSEEFLSENRDFIPSFSNKGDKEYKNLLRYKQVFSLTTEYLEGKALHKDLLADGILALFLVEMLRINDFFRQSDDESDDIAMMQEIALKLILITRTNALPIEEYLDGNIFYRILAIYQIFVYANHSCHPNVVRIYRLNSPKIEIFAIRPITSGEELCFSYMNLSCCQGKIAEHRRKALRVSYGFKCNCPACKGKWFEKGFFERASHVNAICPKCKVANPMTLEVTKDRMTLPCGHPIVPKKIITKLENVHVNLIKANTLIELYKIGGNLDETLNNVIDTVRKSSIILNEIAASPVHLEPFIVMIIRKVLELKNNNPYFHSVQS